MEFYVNANSKIINSFRWRYGFVHGSIGIVSMEKIIIEIKWEIYENRFISVGKKTNATYMKITEEDYNVIKDFFPNIII